MGFTNRQESHRNITEHFKSRMSTTSLYFKVAFVLYPIQFPPRSKTPPAPDIDHVMHRNRIGVDIHPFPSRISKSPQSPNLSGIK
jgi:hypothetical protein